MKINIRNLVKEKDIQKVVKEYLDILKKQGKLWYVRSNSGNLYIPYITKKGLKKIRHIGMAEEGTSDWIIFLANRKTLFIETKRIIGKQTQKQKEFEKIITKLGYKYYICNSIDEFLKILDENIN